MASRAAPGKDAGASSAAGGARTRLRYERVTNVLVLLACLYGLSYAFWNVHYAHDPGHLSHQSRLRDQFHHFVTSAPLAARVKGVQGGGGSALRLFTRVEAPTEEDQENELIDAEEFRMLPDQGGAADADRAADDGGEGEEQETEEQQEAEAVGDDGAGTDDAGSGDAVPDSVSVPDPAEDVPSGPTHATRIRGGGDDGGVASPIAVAPANPKPTPAHAGGSPSPQHAHKPSFLGKGKKFKAHIVMTKRSIPPVGNKLMTPWKELHGPGLRTLGKVTESLVSALPEKDVFQNTHFNSCAIVGSAGLLLTQNFGDAIDAHDAIFRFNIAPVKGFERHVGSRTSIRLVNRHHFGFREFDDEICLYHATLEEAIRKYIRINKARPDLPNYPLDMSFYKKVVLWKRAETPTNGYFGIKLALMLCDRITIFGFLRTWKGFVKYHYFNDEEPNKKQLARDTGGEMPILKELLSMHRDRVHFAHPCIMDSKCGGCPEGGRCDGRTPYPVPKVGYCAVEHKPCFLKCSPANNCKKPTSGICPKGLKGTQQCSPFV